ncbi:bifunctional RNase H/acid phosphatase [Actinocorallia sp. A-T 12471]|uniref:bifunctional RNase H/acid phosphatase n=1 Tax=Actinocorallia sp. A-T 12471 TaxID=3089813 RepID=UPI0029CFE112|nr:bifunctional RNase H/acid phosphatase [Actinocorallia sp. A-T 12471]MDX6739781.1 bifunctional RNase H/acid phosphatase [Actinocorallia sp. A-T 12471]
MSRKLVVEADGGSRGNPGPAGYGAVVLDGITGEVLAEAAESIGRATNNVAEYRGLIAGLRAAAALDPRARVEVRMDSKLVVEQMSGRWQIKHPDMKPLALEARDAASGFAAVSYSWIPRARNTRADALANAAMDAAARGETWSPASSAPQEPEPPPKGGWVPPTTDPTRTLLLRHGQTPLSVERRFAGVGDIPLTDVGRAQAEAAARHLADTPIDVIVASPLRRAQDTAKAVASVIGAEIRTDEGFRETDFGQWEGHSFGEVAERWPDDLAAWLSDSSYAPPGGESFASVAKRVSVARDKLLVRYRRQTVLVVSHVTPIKTMLKLALDAPDTILYRVHLDTASLCTVDWFDDGPAVVRSMNETHYLPTA